MHVRLLYFYSQINLYLWKHFYRRIFFLDSDKHDSSLPLSSYLDMFIFLAKYSISFFLSTWWLSSLSVGYRRKLKCSPLRLRDERSGCPIYDFFASSDKSPVKGQREIRKESSIKIIFQRLDSRLILSLGRSERCFLCERVFSSSLLSSFVTKLCRTDVRNSRRFLRSVWFRHNARNA